MPALIGVSYDIVAKVIGMEAAAAKVTRQSQEAGTRAGTLFSEAFSGRATAATGATARAMATEVNAATSTMEAASARVQRMRDAEFNQIGVLRVAESKLSADRARYAELAASSSGASAAKIEGANARVVASEERVAAAQRGRVAAQAASTTAIAGQTAANEALATSQTAAAGATGAAATRMKSAAAVGLGAFVVGSAMAINSAADFQESQVRLVASAGETEHGMHIASEGILKLAGDVGYSAQELSKGLYGIESAGYHGADGVKVLRAAAQGAKAENADLTEVNNGLTTSMHDFGYSADQSTAVMSKMVVAVGASKENFQNFSAALHSVEPVAAGAHIKLEDVYGVLAQMTQTGMSAAQSTENMRNAINSLSNPTQQMRDQMASLGLNADDVKMKLGERGLAGSMQVVSDAIRSKMNPAQQIVIDTMYKNAQATEDAKKMFDTLPPAAQKVAQAVLDGSESFKDYRKNAGGLDVLQKNQVDQWLQLQKKISGYSGQLKSGKSAIENYNQALKLSTGTVAGQAVALAVTGEHAEKTNALIKKIGEQSSEAGNNVKGWHEIQGNFNTRLAQFKDGLGAAGISIGTVLLPAATRFVSWLGGASHFLTEHKDLLTGITIAVVAMVAAWATFKIASATWTVLQLGITAATVAMGAFTVSEAGATAGATGLAAALAATGISEIVIGVTALVAGLIALGVGVKYAYDHWSWFHTAVSSTWGVLKAVGLWIAGAAVATWNALVGTVKTVAHVFETVGSAASSLYHNAIKPAFDGISTVVRYAAGIITFILVAPIMVAFKVLSFAATRLWQQSIKPSFEGIAAVAQWLYHSVITPVFDGIGAAIHAGAAVVHWLYDTSVKPVLNAVGSMWHWLYTNAIQPVIAAIVVSIHAFGTAYSWVHDNVIKPISAGIGTALSGVRDAFKSTVGWIETQWGRIKGIVSTPAKFIIDTVYNHGIEPLWNGIAGVFGLGKLNTVDVSGFSGGGVLSPGDGILVPEASRALGLQPTWPGYAPGRDSILTPTSTGGMAAVSPGETRVNPAQFGGAQGIWALNHMFSGGRANANGAQPGVHFDIGGIFSGIGDAIGDAAGGVAKAVGGVADWVTDPVGKLKKLFEQWIGKANGAPNGGASGDWRKAITSVPSKMLDGAIDMVKGWFGAHPGGGIDGVAGVGVGGGVAAAPAQVSQWITAALQAVGVPITPGWMSGYQTLIMRESGGNPKAINLTDSNAKAGHPSQGITQTIPSTFAGNHQAGTSNDITDPVANIAASINYVMRNYGVSKDGHDFAAKVQQANSAAGAKGYAGGGIAGLALRQVIPYAGGGVATGSGPQNAIDALKAHSSTPYVWGGGSWGGLDCSGLGGFGLKLATGDTNPSGRVGTTNTLMAGGWPGMVRGASQNDAFVAGVNPNHMAISILGTNFEERTTGETMRVGAAAVSPFDKQFTEQWHLNPSLFRPPYAAGAAATASTSSSSSSTDAADIQRKITAATDAMNKDLADVKAAQASVTSDLAAAARADEQAATATSAALRVKYTADAAKYRANADQQRVNVTKQQHDAEAQKAKIASLKGQLSSGVDPTAATSSSDSGSALTFHDFGSKLGGIAADAISESFSLGNIGPDLFTSSPLFKIGAALTGAKFGKPYTPSIMPGVKKVTPELHDEAAYLPQGISVISKVTRRPELNLGPDGTAKLHALLDGNGAGGGSSSGPTVTIEQMDVHNGDGHKTGREIAREVSPYAQKRPR